MTFVLLEMNLTDKACHTLYQAPSNIIRADRVADVAGALEELDRALDDGQHVAGYLSYELGLALEPRLCDLVPRVRNMPLLWFGVFDEMTRLGEAETAEFLNEQSRSAHSLSAFTPGMNGTEYKKRFQRVQEMISAGDIYQLNLTFPVNFHCEGDPISLYIELRKRQKVSHGALISTPEFSLLSASPELFMTVRNGRIETRPMKGTAPRAPMLVGDREIIKWLRNDEKSQAENLMIVDLMRNDMSRISKPGSVRVEDLYSIETHPTLHQMTSGIHATLEDGLSFGDVVRLIFPSGSITGAPKIRAMELINELETGARGVYTGSIGAVTPSGDMHFNVAIRTAVIMPDGRGTLGIGSGLVADSEIDHEYEECLLKMRFISEPYEPFKLIETLLFEHGADGGESEFTLLDRHLERLANSAAYFRYPYDRELVLGALEDAVEKVDAGYIRVRLTLDRDGEVFVTTTPIARPDPDLVMRFDLSSHLVNSEDVYYYHKTTRRTLFDEEFARVSKDPGLDEAVFLNEFGHVTEGCITNIFVKKEGRLYTPRLSSGLLAGTLRADLIERGEAIEAIIEVRHLLEADAIYLGNSVRGLVNARFMNSP